jgi:hypothetical protein
VPDISADQPDLSPGAGTVKDVAATHQALDTMGAPPGGQTQGNAGPGAASPITPQGSGAPGGPTQPAPQQDQGQQQGGQGRLDMNQVFPPMPQMDEQIPWRESLRNLASHPQAGPALKGLADQISQQHGPRGSK